MPFDNWPYFPSYGAYFRNVGSVILDNVSFTTIGPDTRPDVYTDNVRSLVRWLHCLHLAFSSGGPIPYHPIIIAPPGFEKTVYIAGT